MAKEKLVRDLIPEFSARQKDNRKFRIARSEEYPQFFSQKLLEEAQEAGAELLKGSINRKKLIEELADVLEVVESVCHHFHLKWDDVIDARLAKWDKKGGFKFAVAMEIE